MLRSRTVGEHVHGLIELRQKIDSLEDQPHSAALHAGKIQKLLHHAGKAFCLAHDDVHALIIRFSADTACLQRFRPTLNSRQRRAQLVRNRGNEVVFHFFRCAKLCRHVVDGVAQCAELVVLLFFDAHVKIALCDFFRRSIEFPNGRDNRPHKIDARKRDEHQNKHADTNQDQHDIRNLPVCALHRDDVPHRAEHRAVCATRHARDGHDLLAACELADPIAVPVFAVQGAFKIGLALVLVRRKAGGGRQNAARTRDRHDLHEVFIREIFGVASGCSVKLAYGFHAVGKHGGQLVAAANERHLYAVIGIALHNERKRCNTGCK